MHERDRQRWVSTPSKAWTKNDGSTSYIPLVDFTSKQARDRFQQLALAAIDKLLGGVR